MSKTLIFTDPASAQRFQKQLDEARARSENEDLDANALILIAKELRRKRLGDSIAKITVGTKTLKKMLESFSDRNDFDRTVKEVLNCELVEDLSKEHFVLVEVL